MINQAPMGPIGMRMARTADEVIAEDTRMGVIIAHFYRLCEDDSMADRYILGIAKWVLGENQRF